MSRRTDELYQKILELRAQRLGVSSEEAERVDRSKPLFLLAAEVAAQRLGISPEEVLATDLQRMETSPYPTPECLTPDEVEDLVEAGVEPGSLEVQVAMTAPSAATVVPLPEVRLAHLRSCDACRTLLAASRPEQWRREEFQRFLDAELPRVAAAAAPAARILVVDDESNLRLPVVKALESDGYVLSEAANGRDGLRLIREQKPDLVVLDLAMPEFNGMDVLKAIRANPETEAIPVLIVTAYSDEAGIRAGFDHGATDYLTKPFAVPQLSARVRACLARAGKP